MGERGGGGEREGEREIMYEGDGSSTPKLSPYMQVEETVRGCWI